MEEIKNEQTETLSTPASEENNTTENKGEVSLGKFKDTESLVKAYNSLQAEFTKRCQRLKELESVALNSKNVTQEDVAPTNRQGITDKEKDEILKEYLKNLLGAKQKAIIMDGSGVCAKTPSAKPKSLEEAGSLAKNFLNQ